MDRTRLFFIALLSAVGLASVVASAQTRWVHINHLKSGNFIVSPALSPAVANQANPAGPVPDPWPPSDAYRTGNGVTLPRVLHQKAPSYPAEAQRRNIQGEVVLECIVEVDGSVKRIHFVKSLDPLFGLDDATFNAARESTFAPGTRLGEPVPVLITRPAIFNLR